MRLGHQAWPRAAALGAVCAAEVNLGFAARVTSNGASASPIFPCRSTEPSPLGRCLPTVMYPTGPSISRPRWMPSHLAWTSSPTPAWSSALRWATSGWVAAIYSAALCPALPIHGHPLHTEQCLGKMLQSVLPHFALPALSMAIRSTLGNIRVGCYNQCCTIYGHPLHPGQRPGESKWPVMHFIANVELRSVRCGCEILRLGKRLPCPACLQFDLETGWQWLSRESRSTPKPARACTQLCTPARPPDQALDCTLPEGHPYHQACGLRAGSDASLVSAPRCVRAIAYSRWT